MKNYVKEYNGYEVPDGATKVSNFPTPQSIEFYRIVNGEYQFFNTGVAVPSWCANVENKFNRFAIPLPEQPMPSKSEWMPEVGEECEVTGHWNDFERPVNLKDGQKVKILMDYKCPKTGTDGVIFTWVEGADNIRTEWTGNEKHFRPLKTEEEKKREAFIDMAKKIARTTDDALTHDRLFGLLFDNGAGFTAPSD